ncbi:phage tail protein I [Kushneria pakistanensis]|uniref:Phage tail protein I n=1 Tax=Kushneria pakistanensis TaxID=1508770 RepID=A0ABQ3FSB4_9GAMM|nr:phage tail protein I [Kushneria pakistanensis]GHC34688.1 phage tail protein I [Kushneria pakistanensis]
MAKTILPPHLSELERELDEALSRIDTVEIPIATLWDPWACPLIVLPYLAWALSVDVWRTHWSEQKKRQVVAASLDVHRAKGTRPAIRQALAAVNVDIELIEWWETEPRRQRGTFRMRASVRDEGVTEEMQDDLLAILNDTKPLTRVLEQFDVMGEVRGGLYIGAATYCGDITAVYPPTPEDMTSSGALFIGAVIETRDITTVYPLQES